MKTRILFFGLTLILLASCGASKREAAERKRQQQMDKLDEDKRQFEQKTP